MRKIETGRVGNQIYVTINNCFMRLRAFIKIWNMQEFYRLQRIFLDSDCLFPVNSIERSDVTWSRGDTYSATH